MEGRAGTKHQGRVFPHTSANTTDGTPPDPANSYPTNITNGFPHTPPTPTITQVFSRRTNTTQGVKVTIGNHVETAAAIQAMGAVHVDCDVTQAVADDTLKVVSTPAYMLAQSILDADAGIGELVGKVLAYCD